MNDISKEEWYQELKEEAYREAFHERKMATDYDYALEQLDIDTDSTIDELRHAVDTLNHYGWEITERDILDTV